MLKYFCNICGKPFLISKSDQRICSNITCQRKLKEIRQKSNRQIHKASYEKQLTNWMAIEKLCPYLLDFRRCPYCLGNNTFQRASNWFCRDCNKEFTLPYHEIKSKWGKSAIFIKAYPIEELRLSAGKIKKRG